MNGQSEDTNAPTSENREDVTGPFRVLPPALDPTNEVIWTAEGAAEHEAPTQNGRPLYEP